MRTATQTTYDTLHDFVLTEIAIAPRIRLADTRRRVREPLPGRAYADPSWWSGEHFDATHPESIRRLLTERRAPLDLEEHAQP